MPVTEVTDVPENTKENPVEEEQAKSPEKVIPDEKPVSAEEYSSSDDVEEVDQASSDGDESSSSGSS